MVKQLATSQSTKETIPEIAGFHNALKTFRLAAKRVPAYQDFLHKYNIQPHKIKTPVDFEHIPPVTKENYLRAYPLKDLLWDGSIQDTQMISVSSGSSGEPFFWPRGLQSAKDCVFLHETLFNQNFQTRQKETLVIIALAMGTWIAGTYTLDAMIELANRGHKLVTITPGIDKMGIIRILKQLAPQFSQTIIFGYPPFTKDIIDEAVYQKIKIDTLNLKLVFAGEIISERWRDYVLYKIKAKDPLYTTSNIYGTADAGLLGNESPVSIFARRAAEKNPSLYSFLFPDTQVVPSLVHYFPDLRYIETLEDYLLFTVNNSLPLIRYKILDQGRVISYSQLRSALEKNGSPLPDSLAKLAQHSYITVNGRSDVATSFYAVNIYPENIKYALETTQLQKILTGKFIIKAIFNDLTQEQTLHLQVELKPGQKGGKSLEHMILKQVIETLKAHNSEYNRLSQELHEQAHPIIHLMPYQSPEFEIKVKHRWAA